MAALLGVDEGLTASMPGSAVESFAGVANGETNAGTFEVYGTPFLAAKPA